MLFEAFIVYFQLIIMKLFLVDNVWKLNSKKEHFTKNISPFVFFFDNHFKYLGNALCNI